MSQWRCKKSWFVLYRTGLIFRKKEWWEKHAGGMAVKALLVTNSLKTYPLLPIHAGAHVKTDFVSQKTGLHSAFTSPYVPMLKDSPHYSLNIIN